MRNEYAHYVVYFANFCPGAPKTFICVAYVKAVALRDEMSQCKAGICRVAARTSRMN